MGFLATIVSFTRSKAAGAQAPEAKVSRGGKDTLTAGHFAAPGDDSFPLADDVVYVGDDVGTGTGQILGYQDPKTAPKALAGEKRIYSRSGPGVIAAEIWLKADGSIVVKSATGSIDLDASGVISFTTPLGKYGADSHLHVSPFGPTGAPIPNT